MARPTETPTDKAPRRGGVAWAAGATIIASVAVMDPWGLLPFGPVKTGAVTVCVLAATTVALRRRVTLARGPLILWGLVLGWLLVATVTAVDPLHAWIGTPDRRLGWVTWTVFALAWIVGASLTRHEKHLVRGTAVVATGMLGLYCVLEAAGIAPVNVAFAEGRLGGPYGQPAYLGAAAALLTPTAAGVALHRASPTRWRFTAGASALLGGFALAGSGSRAAWAGIVAAGILAAPRGLRWFRARPRAIRAGAAVAVLVMAALVTATPVADRAATVFDTGPAGLGSRIAEWQVAVAAIGERPFFGYGPEGYRVAFPSAVDAGYVRTYGREVITDRAHSGVLDMAASGGIPAAVGYVGLIGLAVFSGLRALRHGDAISAGTSVGVIAYAAQQQFLFPLAEVDPVFWLLAGTLAAHGLRTWRAPRTVTRALSSVIGLAVLLAVAATATETIADRRLNAAAQQAATFPAHALVEADRATALRPDSIHTWYVAARIAASGPALTDLDLALDRAEQGLARSPTDPALRMEYGALLLERAQRSTLDHDIDQALHHLQTLVNDDPYHPLLRRQLAHAYELAGDTTAAAAHRRAADLLEIA